jgi:hypothetical protein
MVFLVLVVNTNQQQLLLTQQAGWFLRQLIFLALVVVAHI